LKKHLVSEKATDSVENGANYPTEQEKLTKTRDLLGLVAKPTLVGARKDPHGNRDILADPGEG